MTLLGMTHVGFGICALTVGALVLVLPTRQSGNTDDRGGSRFAKTGDPSRHDQAPDAYWLVVCRALGRDNGGDCGSCSRSAKHRGRHGDWYSCWNRPGDAGGWRSAESVSCASYPRTANWHQAGGIERRVSGAALQNPFAVVGQQSVPGFPPHFDLILAGFQSDILPAGNLYHVRLHGALRFAIDK